MRSSGYLRKTGGGCGRILSAPTGRMRSSVYFLKSGVTGGYYPPLQGVYAHLGTCEKTGLRETKSLPYRADAFIRVLAEIRDYGRIISAPTGRERSSGCLRKSGGAGGFYPPLQGVCAHPGACEKPGLRADSIRPYKAYALIQVLAKNRSCGRILSAPTRRMRSSRCLRKTRGAGEFYPPLQGVCVHLGTCEKPGLRADSIRPYSLGGEVGSIRPTALHCHFAGGFYPPRQSKKSTTRMSDALLVDDIGLEPMTFRTSSGCSSQLS